MQTSLKSLLRRALVWLPGIAFISGTIFFLIWWRAPATWLRSAFGACFSIFLIFPALFLAIQPDLVIAYINSLSGIFYLPGSQRPDGTVQLGPPARWIKQTEWKRLSTEIKIIIYVLASLSLILSLVLAANTFGPLMWQWLRGGL